MSQDDVLIHTIETLSGLGWTYSETMPLEFSNVMFPLPNNKGGHILSLGGLFDFIHIYEHGELTYVEILYTP